MSILHTPTAELLAYSNLIFTPQESLNFLRNFYKSLNDATKRCGFLNFSRWYETTSHLQRCHRRKIKCDRKSPCQGCIKANLPCVTPSLCVSSKDVNDKAGRELFLLELLQKLGCTVELLRDGAAQIGSEVSSSRTVQSPADLAMSATVAHPTDLSGKDDPNFINPSSKLEGKVSRLLLSEGKN
jgi:hypothetical protein